MVNTLKIKKKLKIQKFVFQKSNTRTRQFLFLVAVCKFLSTGCPYNNDQQLYYYYKHLFSDRATLYGIINIS